MSEMHFPYPHDADPEIFREALTYSEATTGFTATLIEKDYYCSLVLQYFFDAEFGTSFIQKTRTPALFIHSSFLFVFHSLLQNVRELSEAILVRTASARPVDELRSSRSGQTLRSP